MLGTKLRKQAFSVGRKIKDGQRIGLKTLARGSQGLEVGGRQVKNVATRVAGGLQAIAPYLEGTPLEGAVLAARGAALGVRTAGIDARKIGRDLEKVSKRDFIKEAEGRIQNEVNQFQ